MTFPRMTRATLSLTALLMISACAAVGDSRAAEPMMEQSTAPAFRDEYCFPVRRPPRRRVGCLRALAAELEAMTVFTPREELESAPRGVTIVTRPVTAPKGTVLGHPLLGDRRQGPASHQRQTHGVAG